MTSTMNEGDNAMTMTIQEIDEEVKELLEEGEGVSIIWPQNADALHLGPEGLYFSAMTSDECGSCGQSVEFVPHRVEGHFLDGTLWIQGEYSRQHGCGWWAPDAIAFGIGVDDEKLKDPARLVAFLRHEVFKAQAKEATRIQIKLVAELTEWMAELPEWIAESGDEWDEECEERYYTGSDRSPGIYRENGELVAWDWDPTSDYTEVIVVRGVDL